MTKTSIFLQKAKISLPFIVKENFENFAENSLPFEMLLPASGSVDISSHDFQLNSILPIPPTVGKT